MLVQLAPTDLEVFPGFQGSQGVKGLDGVDGVPGKPGSSGNQVSITGDQMLFVCFFLLCCVMASTSEENKAPSLKCEGSFPRDVDTRLQKLS